MRVSGRNKEDKTSDGNNAEEDHRGSMFFGLISIVTPHDGGEAANNIWRNAHELRLVVRVSHIFDDGREEKRDRVQGSVNAFRREFCSAQYVTKRLGGTYKWW
jgi:hypothetical protein